MRLNILPIATLIVLHSARGAGAARIEHIGPRASSVNKTTCDGRDFVYERLAGYGFVPSDARDKAGDTLGGFGSSIALDRSTWKKSKQGVYTGVLWALPDRGWYGGGRRSSMSSPELTPRAAGTLRAP